MAHQASVFLTGATGLVGTHVLRGLLRRRPDLQARVLVRDTAGWHAHARSEGLPTHRIDAVRGDVALPGLGLEGNVRRELARSTELVIHAAADTEFSRELVAARAVNTRGTEHVLELAGSWTRLRRFVHVSTAFVAGRREGQIPETASDDGAGFVNFYEQSKHEAEERVRASAVPWAIVRPSSIVCDGPEGRVSQINAVHRALRLYRNGLASMMPGDEPNRVDMVSAGWVARCLAAVLTTPGVEGGTYHACSGHRAMTLGRILDTAYAVWAECPRWSRRGICRPALTDLETYRLFEEAVEETGDDRLRSVTRALSHFVPQLAMPKTFETARMERVVGEVPPDPALFWSPMVRRLLDSRWAVTARHAA